MIFRYPRIFDFQTIYLRDLHAFEISDDTILIISNAGKKNGTISGNSKIRSRECGWCSGMYYLQLI